MQKENNTGFKRCKGGFALFYTMWGRVLNGIPLAVRGFRDWEIQTKARLVRSP